MENSQLSFWQFSDQLRLQNTNLANLSLNDSIWSVGHNNSSWKLPEERRNFDIRVGGNLNNNTAANPTEKTTVKTNSSPYTSTAAYNDGIVKQENPRPAPADPDFTNDAFSWKIGSGKAVALSQLNGGFNKGIYYNPAGNQFYSSSSTTAGVDHDDVLLNGYVNKNFNLNWKAQNYGKNIHLKNEFSEHRQIQGGKKKKEKDRQSNKLEDQKGDKRFKTLPPSETLPRNEKIGGYIFVCNNDTMEENLRRQLFGLPPRYRDSVRAITPGLPLFLYNYSTHQLHGIYEAASFGASNIDPSAWEDKKNPGESRFPAQVRVQTRKICDPLDEDAFRPILHHYDGPKFRLQLTVPEALSLLDILAEERGC